MRRLLYPLLVLLMLALAQLACGGDGQPPDYSSRTNRYSCPTGYHASATDEGRLWCDAN